MTIKRQQGMTLLEVMVAMAILAVSGVAVMKSASENLNSVSYLKEKTLALWVADNQMAELQLSGTWPGTSTKKGQTEMAGQTWYWSSQGLETADSNFVGVKMNIYATEERKRSLAELTSYVGR